MIELVELEIKCDLYNSTKGSCSDPIYQQLQINMESWQVDEIINGKHRIEFLGHHFCIRNPQFEAYHCANITQYGIPDLLRQLL